jgi:hypothetical protein
MPGCCKGREHCLSATALEEYIYAFLSGNPVFTSIDNHIWQLKVKKKKIPYKLRKIEG